MPGDSIRSGVVESDIPARLDRLPWTRWHSIIVAALGITWLLDGLETMMGSAFVGVLKDSRALGLSDAQIGLTATGYLAGAVSGALIFGYLTDRLGRRKLFFITLALYVMATAASALAWNFWSFTIFRALTGAGIGGEYAAINSAVDELIPARVRGRVDLIVNSTFWIGAAVGSLGSIVLLHLQTLPPTVSWRFGYGIGAVLGAGVLLMRRYVPESPRWLLTHGYKAQAEQVVAGIEEHAVHERLPAPQETIRLHVRRSTPWREIFDNMFRIYRERSILGFTLMIAQAFFYNAVMFTYGLVLLRYYNVPAESVGYYIFLLAMGNFLGPVLIGHLFDTVGRRRMIFITYSVSGVLLALTAWLFARDLITVHEQALAWSVVFFVASAAASSAYLTVSEIFPLEIRALAISLFYACGTLAGGVGAPALFGYLIGTGSRELLFWGYIAAAALMVIAGGEELWHGVAAERKSLESVTAPLSAVGTWNTETPSGSGEIAP
jgi:MFS family permease